VLLPFFAKPPLQSQFVRTVALHQVEEPVGVTFSKNSPTFGYLIIFFAGFKSFKPLATFLLPKIVPRGQQR
jgi:hypothetical protein